MSSWLPRALSLLGLTIAMLALVALTGCKDAGKSAPAGADTGGTPPPLSAPPMAEKPAAGGMTPSPSGAASAPADAASKP